MENSCGAPAWRGWPALWRTARTELQAAWRHAPRYESGLSWAATRRALLGCVCAAILLFAVFATSRTRGHVDLYPSYVAAHLANEGHWDHIYHSSVWLAQQSDPLWTKRSLQLVAPEPVQGTSFVYHPWYLQALRPLVSSVPYATFQASWTSVNRLCIVAIGLGVALLVGLARWREQALLTILIGSASVTSYSIQVGQNGLAALAFALAAILAWRSRTPLWLGGALAACAWTCKPWCASLVLLCFVLRGLRAGTLTALALTFVMVVLPELVMPRVLMRDYHTLNLALSVVSVPAINNISLLSVLERLDDPDWSQHLYEWIPHAAEPAARTLALSLTAMLFLGGLWLWWRRRPALSYTCAAYLAFMLLPLGICWIHYFIFALPLACICTFGDHSPRVLRAVGLALLALLCGLMDYVEVSSDALWIRLFTSSVYPWQSGAPIVLVAVTCFAALALAPCDAVRGPG